jgi:hypothetical protein
MNGHEYRTQTAFSYGRLIWSQHPVSDRCDGDLKMKTLSKIAIVSTLAAATAMAVALPASADCYRRSANGTDGAVIGAIAGAILGNAAVDRRAKRTP